VSSLQDPLLRAMAALRAALLEVGEPHMLIGGTAVILRGVARLTDDVDATVWAERVDLDQLLAILARQEIVGRVPDAEAFARERQVLLLRHLPTETPMELSLAWLPFEREALQRAELLDVGGVDIPVAAAQDLVIYKTIAWRDRDRTDVERLLRAYADEIDLAYVRLVIAEFAEALDEPERVEDFERLLGRALPPRWQPRG
jgi:Nucleotidyltransferase of unknown function (DUF6036)